MLAATTTVRVTIETREALAEMSAQRGMTTADLIEELVTLEQERRLLASMNAAFAELADDPEELASYRAEQRAWEATLSDGLD